MPEETLSTVPGEPVERWSTLVTRILAPNPSRMTLDGTNTLIVRAPESESIIVVDPGPVIEAHLSRIRAQGPIALVLLTHHHSDHAEAAPLLADLSGAPVRATWESLCIDAAPLADGESIVTAGVRLDVVATPGHTADSVSFVLPDDRPLVPDGTTGGAVLTGDTILGRGTTIIAEPDGSLSDYLRSLNVLADLGDETRVMPAHGPMHASVAAISGEYLAHRRRRLAEVEDALAVLGLAPSAEEEVVAAVTDHVYRDVHPDVRFAALASTKAQLAYLASREG